MSRKEKKYHFIYKTTNLLSGKYYIGMHSTNDLEDGYLGSGTRLRRAVKKYGKENFKREILEFCESRVELKKREEEVVSLNEIAKVDCINLKVGGSGGFSGEEHRKKCSEAGNKAFKKRYEKDSELRDKLSKIVGENMKQNHIEGKINYNTFEGKKHSEETKEKMSKAKKGKGKGSSNSQYGTCWITNEVDNKKIYKGDLIPEGWRLGRKISGV